MEQAGVLLDGCRNALDYAVELNNQKTLKMVESAILNRRVRVAFQPVVQARNSTVVAFYESLLRVLDETGRIIPARDFMAAIEQTEHGRLLDCIALETGLTELARVPSLRLSINMSARSIGYSKWMRILARKLSQDPTVAERLILEITETSAMLVPELVQSFMADLRSKGISFAIDDFGAGYTALRHFKQFSFDILKIDGEFVGGIASDPDNEVLVAAMIAIAQQFDMLTVAECVERHEDALMLENLGINCLQGYYFAAPSLTPPWREQRTEMQA